MHEILNRINELALKNKNEGLYQTELNELTTLRKKYINIFRGSMEELLLNTTLIDTHGQDVTPEKLKKEQAKNKVKAIW